MHRETSSIGIKTETINELNTNFLNNQNYIINKQKNRIISNFIWFKNLSILNYFIEINIQFVFQILIFFIILSIYVYLFFLSLIYTFLINLFFFILLISYLYINSKNKNFRESILDTNSYLFSKEINDNKTSFSAIFITPYIPFIISYIWFLLFNILWAIVFFILWIIFISSKLFKKIWNYVLRFRVVNILFFPLLLLYYFFINILNKNNYSVYVKNPIFETFNWFEKLSNHIAENEKIIVIKK